MVAALKSAMDEAEAWLPAYLETVVAARHHPALAEGIAALRHELHEALALLLAAAPPGHSEPSPVAKRRKG